MKWCGACGYVEVDDRDTWWCAKLNKQLVREVKSTKPISNVYIAVAHDCKRLKECKKGKLKELEYE